MRIVLYTTADQGNLNDERIGFRVIQPCNLKHFAVYHTEKTSNGFYNRPKHVFWFAPQEVNAGDEIVLYTKKGSNNTIHKDDRQVHFIYWGLDKPIMNRGECIVLSEIEDWSVTSFSEP